MKRTKHIALALLASLLTLPACVDDDDFDVIFQGFVLQQVSGDSCLFSPYFYITSTSVSNEIKSVRMVSTQREIPFTKHSTFVAVSDTTPFSNLTDLNSIYQITAVSTSGNTATTYTTLSFAAGDTIGPVLVDDLAFNGSAITCTVHEATNIAALGIEIIPYDEPSQISRVDSYFTLLTTSPTFTDSTLTLTYTINLNTSLANDYALIRVYASNNGVMRESPTEATYTKGNSSFD